MKEYVYRVGYSTYEESLYYVLYHKEKYTKEQLHKIVKEASKRVILSSPCRLKDYTIQNVFESDLFIEILESFGFKQVDYQNVMTYFGWSGCSIEEERGGLEPHIWKVESGKYDIDLVKTMEEALNEQKK